jgi:hypothetical protein
VKPRFYLEERERRRIRRLQAEHLRTLSDLWPHLDEMNRAGMFDAIRAIDAATRAPKKARTK